MDRQTTRQSSGQTRAKHHRPRFNPISKALGRKNRDPARKAPIRDAAPPVVDVNGPSPAAVYACREHPPTMPEPVAVSARGGRHEASPAMQMATVHYVADPSAAHAPGADDQYRVSSRAETDEEGGASGRKRFLLCFPRPKSRHVRSQALLCFTSGTCTLLLLAIYLGLTLPNTLRQGELTILIVLVILASATFFLFSAVRLWLAVTRPERENRRRTLLPEAMGPSRYVVPPKPIPVVLVGDEEAVGMESQAVKSRPPAYGLWRESVRVDPNRLFWQRNQNPATPERRGGPRPPSYASEDGITYVVEAQPRSTLPPGGSDVLESMQRPANRQHH
ncbi:hypothetical protein G6O67_008708 [Ophiocordyceps sinensis]|uniref:Uncharacterized protein n=2 Tax=Ophiocordyceps sinensis TaxID=72228 RepID=A0A8H4LQV5_9HYPO|nr:hypothetical protein OCS_03242 [Ophiocordyceps sinensis CO18]KAF4504094.1 hypothetical protein G6O67_008708 [Ophiocordyceps sinensis]